MREDFREILGNYKKRVREEKEAFEAATVPIDEKFDEMIADAARRMGTSPDVQIKVIFLEREKEAILDRLRQRIDDLNRIKELEATGKKTFLHVGDKKNKPVYWDDEQQRFFLRGKGNTTQTTITKGEMLADDLWNVPYSMDASVRSEDAEQYFTESAWREIYDLCDTQIVITEEASDVNQGSGNDEAYRAIRERQEGKETDKNGVLAERMVLSFFTQVCTDHPEIPFRVRRADPEMDVEDKIDFILSFEDYNRGVTVDVGIQFTTSVSKVTIEKKERQIAAVNKRLHSEKDAVVHDVVLVTVPIRETGAVYEAWKQNKTPGGPTSLWSNETKRQVFEGVLQGLQNVISEDEVASLWKAIEEKRSG